MDAGRIRRKGKHTADFCLFAAHGDEGGESVSRGYTDIHSHLLPGVDDGAASLEQSVRMARIAAGEGIRRVILTPHQKAGLRCASAEGIIRRMGILQEEFDRQEIPIRLYPGSEIFYRHGVEDLLMEGKLRTLAGSSYCLVEFFPEEEYACIRDGLSRLSACGYRPILAHAERYRGLEREGHAAELKREAGCLYQVNAASVSGEAGPACKSRSRKLLKAGLADFVATDAHNEGGRAPRVAQCAAWLEKRLGAEERYRLLCGNPEAILLDREIPDRYF